MFLFWLDVQFRFMHWLNGICIYHKNCPDGFGSALAVQKYCELNHFNCEYIAANHGDTPPDVDGKNVIIVDFLDPS